MRVMNAHQAQHNARSHKELAAACAASHADVMATANTSIFRMAHRVLSIFENANYGASPAESPTWPEAMHK